MAGLKKGAKQYDSADVEIVMLNNIVKGAKEIAYSDETEHQHNPALGSRKPASWSMGQTEYSGSVTLYMDEIVAIEDAVGGTKEFVNIKPFDIIVTYVNEYAKVVQDRVIAKFKGQGREVTGDMGLAMQFDLFVLDIKYNEEI